MFFQLGQHIFLKKASYCIGGRRSAKWRTKIQATRLQNVSGKNGKGFHTAVGYGSVDGVLADVSMGSGDFWPSISHLCSWSCSRARGPQALVFAATWSSSSRRTLLWCLHLSAPGSRREAWVCCLRSSSALPVSKSCWLGMDIPSHPLFFLVNN